MENTIGKETNTFLYAMLVLLSGLFSAASMFSLQRSGVLFSDLLNLTGFISEITSGQKELHLLFILSGIGTCALASTCLVLLGLRLDQKNIWFYAGPLLIGLLSVLFMPLLVSLGIFVGSLVLVYIVTHDKHAYKTPSVMQISAHATAKAILVINLVIAWLVLSLLLLSPSYTQDGLNAVLSGTVGAGNISIDEFSTYAMDQQVQSQQAFAASILDSIENGLSSQTQCRTLFTQSRSSIEEQINSQITLQLAPQKEKLENLQLTLSAFGKYYPYLTAISVFALLQGIGTVLVLLTEVLSVLAYAALPKEEK